MAQQKAAEAEAAPAKPKSKKKLILIVVVLLVLVGGGAGFMALKGGGDKKEEEHHEEEAKHLATVKLDTFVVNLAGSGAFLKAGIMLEYDAHVLEEAEKAASEHGKAAEGGGHGEGAESKLPGIIGQKEPMVRDAVIRILSSKKGEEVMTTDGKESMKEELVDAINEALGLEESAITNIYLTEFLVQ